VKVGRPALDEDAIRMLEELNPDIEFDWTRILKGEPESRSEPDRRSQRRTDGPRRGPAPQGGQPRPHRRSSDQPKDPLTITAEQPHAIEESEAEAATPDMWESAAVDHPAPDDEGVRSEEAAEMSYALVSAAELDEIDEEDGRDGVPAIEETPAPTAAHARLGSEAVLRLRGRYAELIARLRERIQDPARLEELKSQAERLNPDTWVTEAEVAAGLEQYEEVFESLRAVVGRRRRRRRRGPRTDAEPAPGQD
jgi:hypothetical protein